MGKRTTEKVKNSYGNKVSLRKGESVRKDGMLIYRYTNEFGKRISVAATTIEKLREKEKEISMNIINGVDVSKRCLTLNDVYEEWVNTKRGVRTNTIAGYIYNYEKYVKCNIGNKKIANIRTNILQRFYIKLNEEDGLSPRSIIMISQIVGQIFKYAVRQKYIQDSPCEGSLDDIRKMIPHEQSHISLTLEEQERFLNFVKNSCTYNKWYSIFCVMIGCGLRIGEAVGLTWNDIDLENGYIDINHTMLYSRNLKTGKHEYRINAPKTTKGIRKIPMIKFVKDALINQKNVIYYRNVENIEINGYKDFVFINRYGNPFSAVCVERGLKNVIRDANIEARQRNDGTVILPDFTPHSLRSTFCTRMAENKVDINVAMKIMGHRKPETTMLIYTSVDKNWEQNELKNIEDVFNI